MPTHPAVTWAEPTQGGEEGQVKYASGEFQENIVPLKLPEFSMWNNYLFIFLITHACSAEKLESADSVRNQLFSFLKNILQIEKGLVISGGKTLCCVVPLFPLVGRNDLPH